MAKYFNFFPKTLYSNSNITNDLDVVTNIMARFGFESTFKENSASFYEYSIQDSDTPEIIAEKYYGNPERHWVILLFNDIIDAQFDWPLEDRVLMEYITKKYEDQGGFSWARNTNNPHSYYKISTRTSNLDGTSLVEEFQITPEAYANTEYQVTDYTLQDGTTVTETITKNVKTYFDYEVEENEKKRTIILLKPEFIDQVEKEFKRVIK